MPDALRVSFDLYKVVMLAYPRDFRLRFENEMLTTFSDLIGDEWEHKGLSGVALVWRYALGEVFAVAVPLRLQSPGAVAISVALLSSLAFFYGVIGAALHGCYVK